MSSSEDEQTEQNIHDVSQTLHLAKLLTKKLHIVSKSLKASDHVKNSSSFQDVSLAEFSSIYKPNKFFSDQPAEPIERFEDVQREVQLMKLEAKKSLISSFMADKLYDAKVSLRKVQKQIQADTLSRYIAEKQLGKRRTKKQFALPSIATEVVKRCQQPQSYMLFRRHHNFLPMKPSPTKDRDLTFQLGVKKNKRKAIKSVDLNPLIPKFDEKQILEDTRQRLKQKRLNRFKQSDSKEAISVVDTNNPSENSPSQYHILPDISIHEGMIVPISVPQSRQQSPSELPQISQQQQHSELALEESASKGETIQLNKLLQKKELHSSKKTRNTSQKYYHPTYDLQYHHKHKQRHTAQQNLTETEVQEELISQVLQTYNSNISKLKNPKNSHVSSTTTMTSDHTQYVGLAQQQKVLIDVLKLISIERNLSQHQYRSLLLSSLKQLIEKEIQELKLLHGINNFNDSDYDPGDSQISLPDIRMEFLNDKLSRLNFIHEGSQVLHNLQKEITEDKMTVSQGIHQANQTYDDYEKFYYLLKDGDMPHAKDAQILFEVRKLEAIWEYKDQYLMIKQFKQISEGNSQGLLTIQKYEHNKFVKENAKRRHELKLMG